MERELTQTEIGFMHYLNGGKSRTRIVEFEQEVEYQSLSERGCMKKLTPSQVKNLKMAAWEAWAIGRYSTCIAGKAGEFHLSSCRALARMGLMECKTDNNRWAEFYISDEGLQHPEIIAYRKQRNVFLTTKTRGAKQS